MSAANCELVTLLCERCDHEFVTLLVRTCNDQTKVHSERARDRCKCGRHYHRVWKLAQAPTQVIAW